MRKCLEYKKFYLKLIVIFLNIGIGICSILVPAILVTGGFKMNLLGLSLNATHLSGPVIHLLLVLILIKKAIVLERKDFILLVTSLFIVLCPIEVCLRVHPLLLGDLYANKLLSKYHTGCDGIYEYDPIVKMNFMKPNFETIAYWNRYKWHHKTDSWGFRNSLNRTSADIVLLGDSLIYGHGVNQNQTVGYFLERISKRSVKNLGRQGDCAFQEMYILNKYGHRFKPEYVFYFFSPNDISDLSTYLSQDELKQFVETPIEKLSFKDRSLSQGVTCSRVERSIAALRKGSYITEAINYAFYLVKQKLAHADTGESLKWQYTEKAILQMNQSCNENSSLFVIVPILCISEQFNTILNISREHNIPFVDTRTIDNVESFRLPNDGHFTGEGALAVANIVAEYISKTETE